MLERNFWWKVGFAGQLFVHDALASDLREHHLKPLAVMNWVFFVAAIVVTERLFINVAKQMKRFDRNVSPMKTALQKRPEIFHAVRMNQSVHILLSVIDYLMRVLALQTIVG